VSTRVDKGNGSNPSAGPRHAETLAETARLAGASGDRALAVPTDVADQASVKALFAVVKEKLGRVDVLFNNVGTGSPGTVQLELYVTSRQHYSPATGELGVIVHNESGMRQFRVTGVRPRL